MGQGKNLYHIFNWCLHEPINFKAATDILRRMKLNFTSKSWREIWSFKKIFLNVCGRPSKNCSKKRNFKKKIDCQHDIFWIFTNLIFPENMQPQKILVFRFLLLEGHALVSGRDCTIAGCCSLDALQSHVGLLGEPRLAKTFITLETSVTERKGHACLSHSNQSMATILGLIQETLWSGWNGECQASENTSQHEFTGNGSRELFGAGGFDGSGTVIKQTPFTWCWRSACVWVYNH